MMKLTPPKEVTMVAWTRKLPKATAERFSAFCKHLKFNDEGKALDQILTKAMKGFPSRQSANDTDTTSIQAEDATPDATPIDAPKKKGKDAA